MATRLFSTGMVEWVASHGSTRSDVARPPSRRDAAIFPVLDGRDLRAHLASADLEERAYWMGALLREANTRDVWLFVTRADIVALWPRLVRHLGRARAMWAYLLSLPEPPGPPAEARRA